MSILGAEAPEVRGRVWWIFAGSVGASCVMESVAAEIVTCLLPASVDDWHGPRDGMAYFTGTSGTGHGQRPPGYSLHSASRGSTATAFRVGSQVAASTTSVTEVVTSNAVTNVRVSDTGK